MLSALRVPDRAVVLLETCAPAQRAAWGCEPAALGAAHPRLVHCSLAPVGRTGPWAGFRAGDPVSAPMGGNAFPTGEPDRRPLRCTLPTVWRPAGPDAPLGVLD
jgi:crotonobetainyl-CoA:carnitine CoA-transferase CaiB-like acyl-CoA transferase